MPRPRQVVPFGSGVPAGSDPFMSLHREMNRLFDDVFRGFGLPASASGGGQDSMAVMSPQIDVSESDKEIRICADLPGVREQDVDIRLDENVLTIRAERKQERDEENENYHVIERSHGSFQRSLRLPAGIDAENVDASFENGVLTVRIPKSSEAQRSRRIQIQGGQRGQQQIGGGGSQPGQEQPQSQQHRSAGQAGGEPQQKPEATQPQHERAQGTNGHGGAQAG
jgi:HSP20 family protein